MKKSLVVLVVMLCLVIILAAIGCEEAATATTSDSTATFSGPSDATEGDRETVVVGLVATDFDSSGAVGATVLVEFEDGSIAEVDVDVSEGVAVVDFGDECVVELRDGEWVLVDAE